MCIRDRGVAVHRRLEHERRGGLLRGEYADVVHLHVIRMAVAPGPVVDSQSVRPLLAQYSGKAGGCLCDGDAGETAGHGAVDPRVSVAELDDSGAAQRLGGSFQLCLPAPSQGGTAAGGGGQSRLAGCGEDEHYAVALGDGPRESAPGQQRFVVGVGVEGDQRVAHDAAASPSSARSEGTSASPPPPKRARPGLPARVAASRYSCSHCPNTWLQSCGEAVDWL